MITSLLYQTDAHSISTNAHIIDMQENEKGTYIILDQTIFHPQGGGQPSDRGEILWKNHIFKVNKAVLQDGVVFHYGEWILDTPQYVTYESVQLTIDPTWRNLCTQLHSAGHILDIAVARTLPALGKGGKSYHFPDGPYVEYLNELAEPQHAIIELNKTLTQILKEDISTTIRLSTKELENPENQQPIRTVAYGESSVGCGGTHVKHVSEIKAIQVVGISSKKGITRIRYEVLM